MSVPPRRPIPVPALAGALLLAASLVLPGCGRTGQEYATNVGQALDRGKVLGARGDMTTIAGAVTAYLTAEGNLPEAADIHELAGLLEPRHVRRLPRTDPWGGEYDYWVDADSWHVASPGMDGEWDSNDDLEMTDGQMMKMPAGALAR